MFHVQMNYQGIHEYISSRKNMNSLTDLMNLRLWWRIRERKIKELRKDNGEEFCVKEFEELYKKCGITWQNTNSYTPQCNGVKKGMHGTLMEKERCMLSGVGLG